MGLHELLIKQREDVLALEKAKPSGGNKRRIELLEMEIIELRHRTDRKNGKAS